VKGYALVGLIDKNAVLNVDVILLFVKTEMFKEKTE